VPADYVALSSLHSLTEVTLMMRSIRSNTVAGCATFLTAQPQLQKLCFDYRGRSEQHAQRLLTVLQQCTQLTSLKLLQFPSAVLKCLSHMPRLTRLTLIRPSGADVLSLIANRTTAATLTELRLQKCSPRLRVSELSRLQEMRALQRFRQRRLSRLRYCCQHCAIFPFNRRREHVIDPTHVPI